VFTLNRDRDFTSKAADTVQMTIEMVPYCHGTYSHVGGREDNTKKISKESRRRKTGIMWDGTAVVVWGWGGTMKGRKFYKRLSLLGREARKKVGQKNFLN